MKYCGINAHNKTMSFVIESHIIETSKSRICHVTHPMFFLLCCLYYTMKRSRYYITFIIRYFHLSSSFVSLCSKKIRKMERNMMIYRRAITKHQVIFISTLFTISTQFFSFTGPIQQ